MNEPVERIDLLLALIADDWIQSAPDQTFLQYVTQLTYSLGLRGYAVDDDDELIEALMNRRSGLVEPKP